MIVLPISLLRIFLTSLLITPLTDCLVITLITLITAITLFILFLSIYLSWHVWESFFLLKINMGVLSKVFPCGALKLMDDLWVCGLRPSEGSGSAGALAATERHLGDMRRIVFDGITGCRLKD